MSGTPKMRPTFSSALGLVVTFATSREVLDHLEALVKTGLYGPNVSAAAERLVSRGIEDEIVSGVLERGE